MKLQKQQPDFILFFAVLILIIFGLVMVYDASSIQGLRDFKDSYFYIRQQTIWVVLGFISLIFFSFFDYKKFKRLAFALLITSLVLLVAVFIPGLGVAGGGAHRWLNVGPITVQPAEIIKLTGVIFLAALFEKGVRIFPFISLIGVVTFITAVLQKDLGSTIVFVATFLILYFGSGGKVWHLLALLPLGIVAFLTLVFTSNYRIKRVAAFLDPFSDPQGFTYHISQVLIALGSGGLFGLGLGHSRQKFEYIPEVTTDSIFGIVGEELGFFGSSILIALFVILILRGLRISQNCESRFGKIFSFGFTSL